MTPADSRQLVLGAVAVTGITTAVAKVADPKPGASRLPPVSIAIGCAVVGFGLTALSNYAPELAAMFAGLLVTATLLTHGAGFASALTRAVGKTGITVNAGAGFTTRR